MRYAPGSDRPGGGNANCLRPRDSGNLLNDCPAAGGLRGGGEGALHCGADFRLDGGEDLGDQSLLGQLAAAAAARNASPVVTPEVRIIPYLPSVALLKNWLCD